MEPRPHHGLLLAFQAYAQGDLRAAGAACSAILERQPEHVVALLLSALCDLKAGNADRGRRALDRATAAEPQLLHYDFLRPLLQHQGLGSDLAEAEARLEQYLLFRDVDRFLISYPKCGRTWLRLMLGKYMLGNEPGDPLELRHPGALRPDFPPVEVSHDDYPHWKPAELVVTDKRAYAGKRVVFLVRDPRDVVVSNYFQYTRRGDKVRANDAGFDGTLSDFVRYPSGGIPNLVAFYNAWAANRAVPAAFLMVTYEEMIAASGSVLLRVAEFYGWPARPAETVAAIADFARFDNMRRLEETDALRNPRLARPADGAADSYKVRRGKVSGYVDYLGAEYIAYIDGHLDRHLDDLYAAYKR